MPLVRVEVRNEYALGAPDLYREAIKEDPKEILEGVAVAGLVGVLRQLGDLAEFAAGVFHGLQEEVTRTSSRSHKLMSRVQRIEAALSPLEKALLAQRSHLHFAYTAGSNWHTRTRCEQNHFIYSDLPQFIMDTYEDCRHPPSLHLLDKFDPGGRGSCLKRYSDPNFFERASVASGEARTDKISKDKKGRKIKKRRPCSRNGKLSWDLSFSYHSGRMQLTQLNIGGHTSPSQTASAYDATLRSDLGEQSNLDLKNGSDYIEGDFRPSYSVKPEEQESRESIFSPVKRHESDFLDFNFLEEKIADAHDDIQIDISQGQTECGSSSVTWDKKRVATEPSSISLEHAGSSSSSVSWDGKRETVADSREFIQINISHERARFGPSSVTWDEKKETPKPIDMSQEQAGSSSSSVAWDGKRETPEPPTQDSDNDGMRKEDNHNRPLESFSLNFNLETVSDQGSDFRTLDKMGIQPCNEAMQDPESGNVHLDDIESETDHFMDALNTIESESETDTDAKRQEAEHHSELDGEGVDNGVSMQCQSLSSEPIVLASGLLLNGSHGHSPISIPPKTSDETMSSPDTDKQPPETSDVTAVTFWTNGSLLGLQPSKPLDCSVLNALHQDPEYKKDGKMGSSIENFVTSNKDSGKPDQIENLKHIEETLDDSSKCLEYQESGVLSTKTSWRISPADLDINLGKLVSSLNQNTANFTRSNVTASGRFLPVNSVFQAERKHQENNGSSSGMFELGNGLLSTGYNIKLFPGRSEDTYPAGYKNSNAFEQKNHPIIGNRTFSRQSKDLFGGKSPTLSPSSSPPLQHMKLSFQPIDGFESSKLKLNFPDRNTNSESGSDIFPSFQLVPEVSIARYSVSSDLGVDAFYGSSPSLSADCHSSQSESNSEKWGSSESPTSKSHDLYDGLCRISLTEYGRTNHEDIHSDFGLQFPFLENGVQKSESCRSSDLEKLSTMIHPFRKKLRNDTNLEDLVEPHHGTDPVPPPLPPVQWRGMMPHLGAVEDKCGPMTEGSYYAVDLSCSASTISQPKPAPFNEDQINTKIVQKNKSISQKSNGQRENNQGKNTDETDFLHQIRTKSFTLRPTMATKPTVPSGGSATLQVTAILEKANAIRQAVASDGDDDGSWSDT